MQRGRVAIERESERRKHSPSNPPLLSIQLTQATPRSTATTAALAAAIGPSAASLKAWRSGAIAGMDALGGEVAATRSALQVLLGGLEADAAGAKAALAARPRGRALARAPPKG